MRNRNKMLVVVLAIMLVFAFATNALAADKIELVIDGKTVDTGEQAPVMKDDRTLVPLRVIFETLGMKVDWDEASKTITATKAAVKDEATKDEATKDEATKDEATKDEATKDEATKDEATKDEATKDEATKDEATKDEDSKDEAEFTLVMVLGQTTAKVNGKDVTLDVPAQTMNDRTMVPVRFVAESTGAKVDWDGPNNRVVITTTPAEEPEDNVQAKLDEYVKTMNAKFTHDGNEVTFTIALTHVAKSETETKEYIKLNDAIKLTDKETLDKVLATDAGRTALDAWVTEQAKALETEYKLPVLGFVSLVDTSAEEPTDYKTNKLTTTPVTEKTDAEGKKTYEINFPFVQVDYHYADAAKVTAAWWDK